MEGEPALRHFDSPAAVAARAAYHTATGERSSYDEGLALLLPLLQGGLDIVDDWGCNSPHLSLGALRRAGLRPLVRGFDVLSEDEIMSALPDGFDLSGFTYHKVEPRGRRPPVEANTADAAFFNNVVFRAQDVSPTGAKDLIYKGMYGVKLGGVAVWGSNYPDHAKVRHWVPWGAQMYASRISRTRTVGIRPPAYSMFFPQLAKLLSATAGLEILTVQERKSNVEITELDAFLRAIQYEVLRTDLPEHAHAAYQEGLEIYAKRLMEGAKRRGQTLRDISHTGKVVVRKIGEVAC